MLKGTHKCLPVLGEGWDPLEDTVVYEVSLNFSKKKKGVYSEPDLADPDLAHSLPMVLTYVLWEISVTVKHLIKKASPALLSFTTSTVRFWKPSRKCTRVFVACAD